NTNTCKLCAIVTNNNPHHKDVLYQGTYSAVAINIYPYVDNGIHLLIIPYQHTKELYKLSPETYREENELIHKISVLFGATSHEICINNNEGLESGASIP